MVANYPHLLHQRIRIENGRYESAGITDPNVPASLLKYWLRDLANPLILTEYYELCIKHSEDIDQAIEVIHKLPDVNRRIVLYMADFLAVSYNRPLLGPRGVSKDKRRC